MAPELKIIPPAAPLREYVSGYLFLKHGQKGEVQAAPPQLSSGFAFLWGDAAIQRASSRDELPARYFVPVTDAAFSAFGEGACTVVAAKFFPGKFFQFFGWPQQLFFNNITFLDDSELGNRAALLHEALDDAGTPRAQAEVLDGFLLSFLGKARHQPGLIDWALQQLYHSPPCHYPGYEALPAHISSRHLRRLFREHTGFNMRGFIRLLRFYRAYFLLLSGRFSSLLEVALSAGYFDQAHFNRDFRHFMGTSPGQFMARKPEAGKALAWEGLPEEEGLALQ